MSLPLLAQVAIPLGAQLLGTWLGKKATGDPPKVPDISPDVVATYARQRAQAETALAARLAREREEAAAQGVTGSGLAGTQQALYRTTNDAVMGLAASEADVIAQARAQQRALQYQQDMQRYQNRAQAVSDIVGGVADIGTRLLVKKYAPDLDALLRGVDTSAGKTVAVPVAGADIKGGTVGAGPPKAAATQASGARSFSGGVGLAGGFGQGTQPLLGTAAAYGISPYGGMPRYGGMWQSAPGVPPAILNPPPAPSWAQSRIGLGY